MRPHEHEVHYFVFLITNIIVVQAAAVAQEQHKAQSLSGLSDKNNAAIDAGLLSIPKGYMQNLHWDLPLDSTGKNGSAITWKSSNREYVSDKGRLLKYSPLKGSRVKVTMTAMISTGAEKRTRSFNIEIARVEPRYDAYLFAYFEGSGLTEKQEQLRFGISTNAVNWFALNKNRPIIASSEISATGGIRDPHILRGEDGKHFYLVATDMFTAKNGWEHNPGIVMFSSVDLIHWKHGIIDLEQSYPKKFPHVKWVWAPQTIFDPKADKYMVYFTVRLNDDPALDFYCAYANKDFTGFESEPKLIFKAKYGAIDGDIIYNDGVYHFFYKGNTKDENGKEIKNGIQQATGKTLQGPWREDFKYVDAYANKHILVEGSGIFKLNNSDNYILMYDLYRDHRYEFQRSSDLFHFTQTSETFTKNFNPRHGTVISITRKEARRLNQKWGGAPTEFLSEKSNVSK